MGKFVIQNGNGKYRFNLKADNHQVILTSESYTSKSGCENGIESVKINAPLDNHYARLVSKNSKFYFNLKAGNGEIIGTSEMYESESSRDNGIESVKKNAPKATVELE
jgi:hypothetical protein